MIMMTTVANMSAARYACEQRAARQRRGATTTCTPRMTTSMKCHLISLIALVYLFGCVAELCLARYLPMNYGGYGPLMRRQDAEDAEDDDETLDSNASSPYQQDDSGGGGAANGGPSDGYDDPEPDGPYEETPKDQEGQADLERFFDDHLGASERDGMDKENLPTNLAIQLMEPPAMAKQTTITPFGQTALASQTVRTRLFQLPDQKLIITRQITHDTTGSNVSNKNNEHGQRRPRTEVELQVLMSNQRRRPPQRPLEDNNRQQNYREKQSARFWESRDGLDANGSDIVATQDEDDDRVYVTNATNGPFKIDALGGYDPEEDFIDASRDIEGAGSTSSTASSSSSNHNDGPLNSHESARDQELRAREEEGEGGRGRPRSEQQPPGVAQDIAFNEDPESETLFEDASETDEVTFAQDDPQDLEAEMRRQAFDKVGRFNADDSGPPPAPIEAGADNKGDRLSRAKGDDVDKEVATAGGRLSGSSTPTHEGQEIQQPEASTGELDRAKKIADYEDDEGNWVNDGVEDMEIPSQSHQNAVLERAAKREEARRRADEAARLAAEHQPSGGGLDVTPATDEAGNAEDQRMPNADYLRGDLGEFDDSAYKAAAAAR